MGKMVDAVAQGIAFDFLVDGEGTMVFVVVELHLGSVKTSFAFDEITNSGVFYNHARPERITREAEKIRAVISSNFDDDVGPTGEDVLGFFDLVSFEGVSDDLVERVAGGKKFSHV